MSSFYLPVFICASSVLVVRIVCVVSKYVPRPVIVLAIQIDSLFMFVVLYIGFLFMFERLPFFVCGLFMCSRLLAVLLIDLCLLFMAVHIDIPWFRYGHRVSPAPLSF